MITKGQRWYRNIYLHSPAWYFTRLLRKRGNCQHCDTTRRLTLHHVNYKGYIWWNLLLPDLVSKMKTLCINCHRKEHSK